MSKSSQKPLKHRLSPRELLRTILMLDDTPHSIALGTAIGMFIGLTPTVGVQMGLVLVFAFLVRPLFSFNKVAAVLTVYVSNPFTVAPIYWGCYRLGTIFVEGHVTYEDFATIVEYHNFREWWDTATTLFVDVGTPLLVGSLIVAVLTSVPTYPIMLWLIQHLRPTKAAESAAAEVAVASTTDDPAA